MWEVKTDTNFKNSFFPGLICWSDIEIHLGFRNSGLSPPPTLRTTSDQFVEAAHHKVKHFIEAHPNYNHVDKSTEEYGQAILSCVGHFNSNNL